MSSPHLPTRFFNPLMLWVDVALKAQEMLLSSGSVIQIRTERMARTGLAPSAADMVEFQLMGQEKLDAASASGAAMADQMHSSQLALFRRVMQQWVGGTAALLSLATSTTPAQFAEHGTALADVATRSASTMSRMSIAGARVVQRGLEPLHAKATSNARRLARPEA